MLGPLFKPNFIVDVLNIMNSLDLWTAQLYHVKMIVKAIQFINAGTDLYMTNKLVTGNW